MFSRLVAVLQTGERASEELNLAASAVELCVTQQHQVLRGVYPHSAEDSISSQLLGQRVLAAGLADYMLPKVYEGLDELVLGAKSGGNWLAQWDPLLVPGMSLAATRRLMEALGAFLPPLAASAFIIVLFGDKCRKMRFRRRIRRVWVLRTACSPIRN